MIERYPKSSSPTLSLNALLRLGVLCFMKQIPVTETALSDGQGCHHALARMPHRGYHKDVKTYTSLGKGKEGQDPIKNVKYVLRTKSIS